MARATLTPNSLNLLCGMEHAGLSEAALAIERTIGFKKAFDATIGARVGLGSIHYAMSTDAKSVLSPAHENFLKAIDANGQTDESTVRSFIDAELAGHAKLSLATGPQIRDCCIRIPTGWYNCSGFTLLAEGKPWTIEAAVAHFEESVAPIGDAVVRSELASIEVVAQLEWRIDFVD